MAIVVKWAKLPFRGKAKLRLFENADYAGCKRDKWTSCENLTKHFPQGARSLKVEEHSEPWQVFTEVRFQGDVAWLMHGDYINLREMGLNSAVKSFRRAPHKTALTVYEMSEFGGIKKIFSGSCKDLTIYFPEGASSFMVEGHTRPWQGFTEVNYRGASTKLEPGRVYNGKEALKLQDTIKSIRKAPL